MNDMDFYMVGDDFEKVRARLDELSAKGKPMPLSLTRVDPL
jgi:hypothetical protein